MVDANINREERSRSSSMTALSGPAFCYSSSLSSSCTPSESSLPLCSSTHRNRVQNLSTTPHTTSTSFWSPPSLSHHPPSTSRSLEGKGKNPPSLSFPALSLPLHPAATMSGLYSQGFSPARTLSPQIRSNPDADRY